MSFSRANNSGGGAPMARRNRVDAFTLVELVLAIALLSGGFLTMLLLRTETVERAYEYNRTRLVQRLAQEKLDEILYGIETNNQGTFEEQPEWRWEIKSNLLSSNGPDLLECSIEVLMPNEETISGEKNYRLSTWFLPDPEHPLALEAAGTTSSDGTSR
ncbi:MAG: hypothetical protein ACKVX7_18225 [Planctomycetota bacterium]